MFSMCLTYHSALLNRNITRLSASTWIKKPLSRQASIIRAASSAKTSLPPKALASGLSSLATHIRKAMFAEICCLLRIRSSCIKILNMRLVASACMSLGVMVGMMFFRHLFCNHHSRARKVIFRSIITVITPPTIFAKTVIGVSQLLQKYITI